MRAPTLVLAPMQAITHLPFMRVMKKFGGPDYFVTEYFRVYDGYQIEPKILRSITENDTGLPVYAQLIGQDIPALIKTSRELLKYDVAGIDLNLGCPAPVVCRKDAGGGLLRKKEHLNRILGSLRYTIEGKFTVKTRIGYDKLDEFIKLLEIFRKHDLDTLTIHARTVKEKYQTPIHPEMIQAAVETMNCPVIANGNVVDVDTGKNLIAKTNAAGLMIGRGAIRNPWIFSQIRDDYAGKPIKTITRSDLLEYIHSLYDSIAEIQQEFDERKHVQHMKKYLVYITQGLDEAFEHQIRRAVTAQEFHTTCQTHLDSKQVVPILPLEKSKLFCGFRKLLK